MYLVVYLFAEVRLLTIILSVHILLCPSTFAIHSLIMFACFVLLFHARSFAIGFVSVFGVSAYLFRLKGTNLMPVMIVFIVSRCD
jgi:TctA family transporter